MNQSHNYKILLNQSVIAQLYISLKSLDLLGNSIAAAHVDAAIQILKDSSNMDNNTSGIDSSLDHFDAKSDVSEREYPLSIHTSDERYFKTNSPARTAVI